MRQENQNGSDTGDDAVDQEAAQRARCHHRFDPLANPLGPKADPIHRPGCKGGDRLEDQKHQGDEEQQAQPAMRQPAIDPIASRYASLASLSLNDTDDALLDPPIACAGFKKRDRYALGGQMLPGLCDLLSDLRGESLGNDSIGVGLGIVDQEAFDLESRQGASLRTEPSL